MNKETATLFDIISEIETAKNQYGIRFEPTVFARFQNEAYERRENISQILRRIVHANLCTLDTAKVIFSSSFGSVQAMGFNVYGFNYLLSIGEFLGSVLDQMKSFNDFLTHNGLKEITPDMLATQVVLREKFALRYNGSLVYMQSMIASLQHFGFTVE
jgi:hypothetical protein